MTRTIGVVTTSRADYGIYRPVLRRIHDDSRLHLHLLVAGAHWLEKYGLTGDEIGNEGLAIGDRVEFPLDDDTPEGISRSTSAAVYAFAECYARRRPDVLMVLGDRFEMHAAALAALPFKIPVAHIHGGELTLGAVDNALRYSITMLSHLHFAAAEEYKQRLLQMGEEPWRVHCTGAPALDQLENFTPLTLEALSGRFGFPFGQKPILITFHPVTLEYEKTEWHIDQLLNALQGCDHPMVFTGPNTDTSNGLIWDKIHSFVATHPQAKRVVNFGPDYYFSMLAHAAVMVGNSSSGLVEAPSFQLPVVNIGTRQQGRIRARNVIDVGYAADEIKRGMETALSPHFREGLRGTKNPYGDGKASARIVDCLNTVSLDQTLIMKRFIDHGRH